MLRELWERTPNAKLQTPNFKWTHHPIASGLTGTLADTTAFRLDSTFTRSTGLLAGTRPRRTTTEPSSFRGVILQEQSLVAGSAVFTDPGIPAIGIDAEQFTAPVSATLPP